MRCVILYESMHWRDIYQAAVAIASYGPIPTQEINRACIRCSRMALDEPVRVTEAVTGFTNVMRLIINRNLGLPILQAVHEAVAYHLNLHLSAIIQQMNGHWEAIVLSTQRELGPQAFNPLGYFDRYLADARRNVLLNEPSPPPSPESPPPVSPRSPSPGIPSSASGSDDGYQAGVMSSEDEESMDAAGHSSDSGDDGAGGGAVGGDLRNAISINVVSSTSGPAEPRRRHRVSHARRGDNEISSNVVSSTTRSRHREMDFQNQDHTARVHRTHRDAAGPGQDGRDGAEPGGSGQAAAPGPSGLGLPAVAGPSGANYLRSFSVQSMEAEPASSAWENYVDMGEYENSDENEEFLPEEYDIESLDSD